jgi:hypothetical protein
MRHPAVSGCGAFCHASYSAFVPPSARHVSMRVMALLANIRLVALASLSTDAGSLAVAAALAWAAPAELRPTSAAPATRRRAEVAARAWAVPAARPLEDRRRACPRLAPALRARAASSPSGQSPAQEDARLWRQHGSWGVGEGPGHAPPSARLS